MNNYSFWGTQILSLSHACDINTSFSLTANLFDISKEDCSKLQPWTKLVETNQKHAHLFPSPGMENMVSILSFSPHSNLS